MQEAFIQTFPSFFSFPSIAGRSLRSLGFRALRRAGAVAPAGPLRGPVPLISRKRGGPRSRPGLSPSRTDSPYSS